MRTYTGILVLQDIFDYVPTNQPDIHNLATSIFQPNVLIVENDCGTTLGKFEIVSPEAEGLVELATDLPLSAARINTLLTAGIYSIATRHTSTCISKGGVCKLCYSASYPNAAVPKVLDRVNILPEYLVNAELATTIVGLPSYEIATDSSLYSRHYVYSEGNLLVDGVDYTISNNVLTLTTVPTYIRNVVTRLTKLDNSPFLGWLAATYSGALLGMQTLPFQKLPLRSLLLASFLTDNRLQLVSDLVKEAKQIPVEYTSYIDNITDPLEKALYMIAIFSIYYNSVIT